MMDMALQWLDGSLHEFGLTFLAVIAALVVDILVRRAFRRLTARSRMLQMRGLYAVRIARAILLVVLVLALIMIWEGSVRQVYLALSTLVGFVAIGFIAVWSLLSNPIAGFFLFLNQPFGLDDELRFLPDDVGGRVVDMNAFYIVLREEDGALIHIPNNMAFQKAVRVRSPRTAETTA